MAQNVYIFIGNTGSGKGTQAKLLAKHLQEKHPDTKILYQETGARLREFIQGNTFTQGLSKTIMDEGGRQPDFLAVHMWSQVFSEAYTGKEAVFIDGTPRSLNEARILDSAIHFYGWNATVFYLSISEEEVQRRLEARGRADDKDPKDVQEKLAWFRRDVLPAVDYYKNHTHHTFLEIDGEKSIEAVQEELRQHI